MVITILILLILLLFFLVWFFISSRNKKKIKSKKPGRNEPCWCGSGKKYKKCHFKADAKKFKNPVPGSKSDIGPIHRRMEGIRE